MITDPADREKVIERIRRVNCRYCEAGRALVYEPSDTEYYHEVEIVVVDPLGTPVRVRSKAWCAGTWVVDYYRKHGRVLSSAQSAGEST